MPKHTLFKLVSYKRSSDDGWLMLSQCRGDGLIPWERWKKCFSSCDRPPASIPLWENCSCQAWCRRDILTGNLCTNSLEWRITGRAWQTLNLIKKKTFKLKLCLSNCISLLIFFFFGTKPKKKSHTTLDLLFKYLLPNLKYEPNTWAFKTQTKKVHFRLEKFYNYLK